MSEELGPDVDGEEFKTLIQASETIGTNEREEQEKYPFDGGIIIFGHGYSNRSYQLSLEAKMRATAAYQLWKEGLAPRIILTGGAPSETDKEKYGQNLLPNSEQMANMLIKRFHVPEEAIINESQSTNTIENTAHALTNLEKQGLPTNEFVTVSTGYHMDRITEIMNRFGLKSQPISAEQALNNRSLEHAEEMKQKDIKKGLQTKEIEKNYLMRKGRYDRVIQRIYRTNEQIKNEIKNEGKWLNAMREIPGYWIPQTIAVRGNKLKEVVDTHREKIEEWLARHPDMGVSMEDLIIGNFEYKKLVEKGREMP